MRDDAAVVRRPGGGSLVVSVDSVVEGVHVDLSLCSPADVGWKALMGALSDLAAMGAAPLGALVALCVPGGSGDGELALGVMAGVAEASAASGCPVVGGDVSAAGELVVAVTVLGTVAGRRAAPVSRSGGPAGRRRARDGPVRWVGGGVARAAGRAGRRSDAPAGLPPAGGPAAEGDAGPAGRRPRHDRRLRRAGARPAPAGRRVGRRVRARRRARWRRARRSTRRSGGGEDYELLLAVAEADVPRLSARSSGGSARAVRDRPRRRRP